MDIVAAVFIENIELRQVEGPSTRIDLTGVELPAGADVYLCGPIPFMAAVKKALLERGVAGDRIRYEVFGPDQELSA